jgi:hypothetical protein
LLYFPTAVGHLFPHAGPIGALPGRRDENLYRIPVIRSTISALSRIYSGHALSSTLSSLGRPESPLRRRAAMQSNLAFMSAATEPTTKQPAAVADTPWNKLDPANQSCALLILARLIAPMLAAPAPESRHE